MIINASPLIIFGKLNRLDILIKLFKNIEIAREVHHEVVIKGGKLTDAIAVKEYVGKGRITIVKLNEKYSKEAHKIEEIFSIDSGEANTIALALQRQDTQLIIDEKAAREAAKSLNMKPFGSLGVLLRAFKNKIISESDIQHIINEMLDSKYRVGPKVINTFWNKLAELK